MPAYSRRTLGAYDSIQAAQRQLEVAYEAWRIEAVKPTGLSDFEQRRLVKGLDYDLKQARKGLEWAKKQFFESALADISKAD